jgi:hypothetical protein
MAWDAYSCTVSSQPPAVCGRHNIAALKVGRIEASSTLDVKAAVQDLDSDALQRVCVCVYGFGLSECVTRMPSPRERA